MADNEGRMRLTRDTSLALLYAPALAFERLSLTLDKLSHLEQESAREQTPFSSPIKSRPQTADFTLRPPPRFPSSPVSRGFAFNHSPSLRRKPVPRSLEYANECRSSATTIPEIDSCTSASLQQAGNAAQEKRRKRRVSAAFSELLLNMSDQKDGEEVAEGEEDQVGEERPRRIKRLKTRITSWFGMPKPQK